MEYFHRIATARLAQAVTNELQCSPEITRYYTMSQNDVVRARIDARIKEEAAAVLASMGLSVSDAFRILLTRVAREKKLPFEPLVPNTETIEAMKEARRGGLASFDSAEALMADLHADD
jgi:DNA-damage-inducible protein J